MKYLLLKLSPGVLSLTPVRSGHRPVFGAPSSFELPPDLRGGGVFANLPAFTEYVKQCRRDARLSGKKIVFCLEDENVVTKEYHHLPCKPKDLLSLARLEAESVLSDDVDDYLIQICEYGRVGEVSGKLTGTLFAAHSGLIAEICRSFSSHGMKVVKIVPPVGGLLYAAKHFANCREGTVAILDLDFEKTRLLVLNGGYPVFQRTFEGIYEDIVKIVMRGQSLPFREAEAAARGFGLPGGLPEELRRPITDLLEAGANEVVRNLRMVLSSERLELNRIFLCGAMSVLPGYGEFWNSLSLDVPLENIGALVPADRLPRTSPQANRTGLKPAAFFSAWGLLRAKKAEDFNFLNLTRDRRKKAAGRAAALAILTLVSFCVMALQPTLYLWKTAQAREDQAALSGADYVKIRSLLSQESTLSSQAAAAEAARSALPYGKSKSEEISKKLFDEVGAGGGAVTTCTIDNNTGSITLMFSVPDYGTFLGVKHSVESAGFFIIAIPFTFTSQDGKSGLCSVTLNVKDFKPFGTKDKGGAAK